MSFYTTLTLQSGRRISSAARTSTASKFQPLNQHVPTILSTSQITGARSTHVRAFTSRRSPISPSISSLPSNRLSLTQPFPNHGWMIVGRNSNRATSCRFSDAARPVRMFRKKHKNSRSKIKKGKQGDQKNKVKAVDPNKLTGPRGRLVMTEERFLGDETLQNTLRVGGMSSEFNPKVVLHNAKNIMEFDVKIQHKATPGSQPLFLATMTTTYPDGVLASYGKDHPHVLQRIIVPNADDEDSDDGGNRPTTTCTELVCMGVASSKKRAETLAAADTLALWYEIGIDGRDPPNIRKQRQLEALGAKERQKAEAKALFKADLARAQMILEMLNSSRPTFDITEGDRRINGNPTWTATASCFLRGNVVSATGDTATKRAEAEGKALIELAKSEELERIVGSNVIDTYQTLIDSSPGQHIASLQIPPIPDDLLEEFRDCVGSASDHELRIQRHYLTKDEYEYSLRERHGSEGTRKGGFRQNSLSADEKKAINKALKKEEEERSKRAAENPNGKEAAMKSVRDALPIKKIQLELLEALRTQQVVVVSGGTGSGKSTQCPQYILEDAIANGTAAGTQIIVTQPRRIAAVSVSERVAAERNENIGNSIGYTVRFKRQSPREYGGSVEFVTTGVLLRRLINDPTLAGISHVMIDEVHERDINTDFLLVLLRDLLKERPDLRVVLMSATLDAESFSDYFSHGSKDATRAPLLSVPTQPRHPVEVFYLEDLINSGENSIPSGTAQLARSLLQYNDAQLKIDLEEALEEEKAAEELQARSRAEDEGETLESDPDSDSDDESLDTEVQSSTPNRRVETLRRAVSLRVTDGGQLNLPPGRKVDDKITRTTMIDLVVKVAQHLSEEELEAGRSGSILCFLPGWDEIKLAMEELEKTSSALRKNLTVLPLHSTIPHEDQQRVFDPAAGKVKVILATNIAESSVTIDDVLAVVDSGLVRELNYDAESAMSAMETNKTSRASATQRLGRAGRVAPGKCYRLYSRGDFEAMPARPTPEIQRTALEATCLQTCSMTTKHVEVFLSQALDPPAEDSVSLAMERLIKLGAINVSADDGQALSPLGRLLARLPLDPATGRMLIMGVVMKCLDPLLTSAACFSSRSTFVNPPGKRDEANEIRKSFSDTSDILSMMKAYDEFWSIVDDQGWPLAKEWAFDNFVSISAMVSIKAVRSQLLGELKRTGMVPPTDFEGRYRQQTLRWDAEVNKNADNEKLYTAIWATAFPGNLASRRPLGSFGTLRTRLDQHAGLHPSSVLFIRKPPRGRGKLPFWYLYREMVFSSQIFLRAATGMDPSQILLFGGYTLDPVESDTARTSRVSSVLDDWIVVEGSCKDSVGLLTRARAVINLALEHKVMFPKASLPAESQEILDIVCDILDPSTGDDEFYE